jgi:molybdopterin converting factor small subunit
MAVKVKLMSSLKTITGTRLVELPSSMDTAEKVMEELLRLYPQLKDEMFYAGGNMDYIYQLLLYGKRLSWPDDKNIKVKNSDELMIKVFMSGQRLITNQMNESLGFIAGAFII